MDDVRDFGALAWLRGEIDKTLAEARGALETFFENPGDSEALRSGGTSLQQVRAALQMAELSGPLTLAEQMESLARRMLDDETARRREAFDALTRAILVLPNYLEWVSSSHRDLPLALLPLVNELRGLRGEPPLEPRELFSPDLSAEPADWTATVDESVSAAEAARLRPLYESGLLEWLRDPSSRHGLAVMVQVADRLKRMSSRPDAARFWWLVGAAIEALADDGGAASADVKRSLRRVDHKIRALAEQGEPILATGIEEPLLKDLLLVVAKASRLGPRAHAVKGAFHLADAWPTAEMLERVRGELAAPASVMFQGVLPALQEDLATLKDALDVLARQGSWQGADLAVVVARLRRVGDTVQMLGLTKPSRALREQADRVAAVAAGKAPAESLHLGDVAGAVLQVEAALGEAARGGGTGAAGVLEAQQRELMVVVIRQARGDMAQVMEAIEEYVLDRGRADRLPGAKTVLRQASGALSMLGLSRPTAALDSCNRFLEQLLVPAGDGADARSIELFADILAGLAEYLGAAEQGQDVRAENWLQQVEQRLAVLEATVESAAAGEKVPPSAELTPAASVEPTVVSEDTRVVPPSTVDETPEITHELPTAERRAPGVPGEIAESVDSQTLELVPAAPASAVAAPPEGPASGNLAAAAVLEGVDPEVVEVFMEEAEIEAARVAEYLQRWKRDPGDTESLKTVRRSFHTLKGSGRMVGAMVLGDFAWAFENMLNRVIDGTVQSSRAMFALLDEAQEALGQLLQQLKGGGGPAANIAWLRERADAMSQGLGAMPFAIGVSEQAAEPEVPVPAPEKPGVEAETTASLEETQPVPEEAPPEEITGELPAGPAEAVTGPPQATTELPSAPELPIPSETVSEVLAVGSQEPASALEATAPSGAGPETFEETRGFQAPGAEPEVTAKSVVPLGPSPAEEATVAEDLAARSTAEESRPPASVEVEPVGAGLAVVEAPSSPAAAAPGAEGAEMPPTPEPAPSTGEGPTPGAALELDPELAAIFFQEATDLLENNEAALEGWRAEPEQPRWRESLQRSLHTLKGSARMAGVSALGDLSHALESLLAAAVERRVPVGPELFDLLQAGTDRLAQMLDSLRGRAAVTPATDFLQHLDWVVSHPEALRPSGRGVEEEPPGEVVQPAAPADSAAAPLSDEERALRALFFDESGALLAAATEGLAAWRAELTDLARLAAVRDSLRALQSGAAVSRLPDVEGIAGEVVSVAEALQSGRVGADDEVSGSLHAAVDWLADSLTRLRNGSPPSAGDQIRDELRKWTGSPAPVPATRLVEATAEVLPFPAKREPAPSQPAQYEQVRVRADLLDRLVNLAGEVSIYRARLEQQVHGFHLAIDEFQQTSERLADQLRRVSIETEAQMLFRHQESASEDDAVFDPLELDRYSVLQQLSRSLNESVSDLDNIRSLIDNLTRDAEMLLVQQGRAHTELQEGLMHTRMLPFAVLVPRLNRMVRQLCTELGKQAEFRTHGGENELDRAVLDKMVGPLEHILRNAIDHGIEPAQTRRSRGKPARGSIDLRVTRQGTDVIIHIEDDGGGIDLQAVRRKALENALIASDSDLTEQELLQLILESGFSTAARVSQVSGRGVGLDVVDATVKQLGGTVSIGSRAGRGMTFTIRLPLMLSITQALIVQAGQEVYAVPLGQVQAVTQGRHEELARYYRSDAPTVKYAGSAYQFMHLSTLLGGAPPELPGPGKKLPLLLMRSGENQVALQVEAIIGRREIVVKPLGPQLGTVRGLLGATILGDGRPALILDSATVVRRGMAVRRAGRVAAEAAEAAAKTLTVMVVDDSITMRKVTARLLERHRMRVLTASDGVDALEQLQEEKPDVMILDIEMPRMDGYELARHIRHNPDLKDIPIVMVTSRIGEKHRQYAMDLGVDRYLGKPYQETDLIDNIRSVLQERR
jgi:chemosensory pili system protein ChpA (sensor histidine kinase/response regulator)